MQQAPIFCSELSKNDYEAGRYLTDFSDRYLEVLLYIIKIYDQQLNVLQYGMNRCDRIMAPIYSTTNHKFLLKKFNGICRKNRNLWHF